MQKQDIHVSRNQEYILQKSKKRRKMQFLKSLCSFLIAFAILLPLILPAIALSADENSNSDPDQGTFCGIKAHTHSESCYETQKTLICGYEEGQEIPMDPVIHVHTEACWEEVEKTLEDGTTVTEKNLICGYEEGQEIPQVLIHQHTEECYQENTVLICSQEEHQHTDICYADATADVETYGDWAGMVASLNLTGNWAEDVVTIARSQLGYHDSEKNFTLANDGSRKYYSRFGAWYGLPYEDWCAMFVSFCMYYAGIPQEVMPSSAGCTNWAQTFTSMGIYHEPSDGYQPKAGDLIFFRSPESDSGCDHVGIVQSVAEDQITTVEGNITHAVVQNTYSMTDPTIVGYTSMPEKPVEENVPVQNSEPLQDSEPLQEESSAAGNSDPVQEESSGSENSSMAEPNENTSIPENSELNENSEDSTGSDNSTENVENSTPVEESSIVPEITSEETSEPAIQYPAVMLDAATEDGTIVTVEAPEGAFPDGVKLHVKTVLIEEKTDVKSAIDQITEGIVVYTAAVDITFTDASGQEIEPLKPIKIAIVPKELPEELPEEAEPAVIHLDDQGNAELVEQVSDTVDDTTSVTFESEKFSVYVVAYQVETYYTSVSGETYKITMNYTADAKIPEGASLDVSEILSGSAYDEYLRKAEDALGWAEGSTSFVRVFDIKILDVSGEEVKIQAPVDVKIELTDIPSGINADENTKVVHFAGETEEAEVVDSEMIKSDTVSFSANGFSAYAIVTGPGAVPMGWHKAESLDQLTRPEGFYIGHTSGYYFMNTLDTSGGRTGIKKTKPASTVPPTGAAVYYFEKAEGTDNQFYAYTKDSTGNNLYVYNGGDRNLSFTQNEDDKTAFTVTVSNGIFTFEHDGWYWNQQGNESGSRFCSWNTVGDKNNNMNLWYYEELTEDPYDLNGQSYGLMNWNGGAAGKALMAEQSGNSMKAKALTVMSTANNTSQLFAPNDSDISMWTFEWIDNDHYYLKTTVDESLKYLRIDNNGLSLVSEIDENCQIQVVPGTGIHAGELFLKSAAKTLTYNGTVESGFGVGGSAGTEWLYLVKLSELTSEYLRPYSASKISVSNSEITNGSRVIIYTRSWNETKKKYDFFAINSDGTLIPVYESGDSIEWSGGQINTLLWDFVEYYWEGTTDPNYYYELYNQYSGKYLVPQITGNQIESNVPVGINLNGRRDGKYYSTILSWDEISYDYAGLKVQNGQIVACSRTDAMDFYFATIEDLNVDDEVHTVPTVDHTLYGITMRIVDLENKQESLSGEMNGFMGSYTGGAVYTTVPGLLSTDLQADGYPKAAGGSLGVWFNDARAREVNHLFIESTYNSSGYFMYDSTQNFASLQADNNFKVYRELGTYDSAGARDTLKHGQFLPFNDIHSGSFASVNPLNIKALRGDLSDSDPRKYEKLYTVEYDNDNKVDCYFALELEAKFTQTPSGQDAWGHDIIFEFTGDDDFWLYVDNELIIDLGGIHSAIPGSVNFATGEVNVNGKKTTIRDLFIENYKKRGHTQAEAEAYVADKFIQKQIGNKKYYVFKDDTDHTMHIFYMERGAGASNLQMRFNLATVKKGTVQLSKELSGVDTTESVMSDFPYQIFYQTKDGAEHSLTNALPDSSTQNDDYVFYKDSVNPVKYEPRVEIDGIVYNDVFFLKPGETAEINFPDGDETTQYRIVECCVNTTVFDLVTVNDQVIEGTSISGRENRKDFGIDYATTGNRSKVNYINKVDPNAIRTLTITKKLFKEDGITDIDYSTDQTTFTFRLYLASEYDQLELANMYTYHVKNPEGYYCKWNKANQRFEIIGSGIREYDALSDTQKVEASFPTSIYGQISEIPAGYTVVIRDLLAGTKYRVEERSTEIPDGYSLQKYILDSNVNDQSDGVDLYVNPEGIIVAKQDPHVDVCNLKGWGLRVNKTWSDADYMSNRDPVYFAVYTENEQHELTLVPDTVRQMAYHKDPKTQTLYWYFLPLPVNVPFDHYKIREVKITAGTPVVDNDGIVTNSNGLTIVPIDHGGELKIHGTQKGESSSAEFTYSVLYKEGIISSDSNVRVDTVTNSRPGIELKKTKWDGSTPLAGATFVLKDNGNIIGEFTSDETGIITTAFLSENKPYTLTETKTPQGWYGLQEPITITLVDGTLSASVEDDENKAYFVIDNTDPNASTLIIKDRPYTFQVVKVDGDTNASLKGVKFALHREVTVDGVTAIDINPMPGYENLETGENGIIPSLDNTLPAGKYELREKAALDGYDVLSSYIQFTISQTGEITLGIHPEGTTLSPEQVQDMDETIAYVLTISNYRRKHVSIWKTNEGFETITTGAGFALYRAKDYSDETGQPIQGKDPIASGTTGRTGEEGTIPGILYLGELPIGEYRLVETQAPEGYKQLTSAIKIVVSKDGVTAYQQEVASEVRVKGQEHWVAGQNEGNYQIRVWNVPPGVELPMTGGAGTKMFYLTGLALILGAGFMLLIKRKRKEG